MSARRVPLLLASFAGLGVPGGDLGDNSWRAWCARMRAKGKKDDRPAYGVLDEAVRVEEEDRTW